MRKEIAKDKSLDELMALADELGRNYFRQGLNCAECVLRTFMDIYECDVPDEVICMATGFGGGMGHTKNSCGAITGAVLALGLLKGRRDPFGPKEEMGARVKHLQGEIYPVWKTNFILQFILNSLFNLNKKTAHFVQFYKQKKFLATTYFRIHYCRR